MITTDRKPEAAVNSPVQRRDQAAEGRAPRKRVWIDMDNSPHVPLFAPIIAELKNRGFDVLLSARNAFQVTGLLDLLQIPNCHRIGRHYGKSMVMKLLGLGVRTAQMLPLAWRESPHVAVSHGSRAQLLSATLLGIPTIHMGDYEFTRSWFLIRPTWVVAPEVIPSSAINCDPARVLKYPGLKEDVYIPSFKPVAGLREELGVAEQDLMVTMRPPATEAHYHNPEAEVLFRRVVERLGADPQVRIVVLPRTGQQTAEINQLWPDLIRGHRLIIPDRVLDGLNLIWWSDFVISGGGTMNREAAALGVPVYSFFRGKIGAVDRHLVETKRLVLLQSEEEVRTLLRIERRPRPLGGAIGNRRALETIVDHVVMVANYSE
jgi:predicted glycosyltransferase